MVPIKVGVLGGIGPEATGIFYLKLIEKLQKNGLITRNSDFPQICINSIPAPELIFDKINSADLEMYIKGLKELDLMKPDFIIMVCNTIHLYHKHLQSEITTEIIDLRAEVYKKFKELNIKNVTILGTPSTVFLGLYKFKDINYFNPNEDDIRELSNAVFNFNKGICKDVQRRKVKSIVEKYLTLGSEIILLACTEFAVMLSDSFIPKLNTIEVLVDCVIERYKQKLRDKNIITQLNG